MHHYKDGSGGLYALSDEDIASGGVALLPAGCVGISDAEVLILRALTVEQIKDKQMTAINACAAARLATLSASYPGGEVQSWAQQTREAEALAADQQATAPLLTAIATARGVPLGVLAERVRAKVQAYAVASGQIIGQRQALEDAINAVDLGANDAAERLEAIQWPA